MSFSKIDNLLNDSSININYEPKKCLKYYQKIYKYSVDNKYKIGQALSLSKIAQCYSIQYSFKEALETCNKGDDIANEIDNDSIKLYLDFVRGIQYGRTGLNEIAIKLLDKCIKNSNCIKAGDKRYITLSRLYTFKAYFLGGVESVDSYKALLKYHLKAMRLNDKVSNKKLHPGYNNVGLYYFFLKKYDSAEYYYKKSIYKTRENKYKTCEAEYSNLGELCYYKKEYKTALKYLDSATTIVLKTNTYYALAENYQLYSNIYKALNDKENYLKYLNLQLIYKDSTNIFEKKVVAKSSLYLIKELELNKQKAIARKNNYIILVTIILILFCLVFYYLYSKRKLILKESLDKEKDIEVKGSEIVNLKRKIYSSYQELIELAKKNDPLFVCLFTELYSSFYKKLKQIQPSLTITEQKVCFYIKLKFSSKEISEYTFVTIKAVQNRKNRLRKRLNIPEGEDIYDWFDNLSEDS